MKTSDIRSMGLAYLEVLEGKAVNKHGHDRVGQEDPDVNNDKKVDGTDKYLLNRRKAISANIRKEETEEVDEALVGNQHKIDANKNGKVDSHDFHLLRKRKKVAEEKEESVAHEKAEKKTVSAKAIKNALASAKAQAKPKSAVSLAKTPWNEEVDLDEAGAFSYGAKAPRKGSSAYNAMMMRKQQEKNQKPIEPKDQMVGNAKVTKEEVEDLDEISAVKLGQYSTQAARQGGSDKRVAGQKMADEKVRKKYGYSSSAKVAAGSLPKKEATEWPIFARIQEKANAMPAGPETKKGDYEISKVGDDFAGDIKTSYNLHNKGAHPNEPHGSTISKGEKDFIDAHGGLTGTDSGHSAVKNSVTNAAAVRNSVKQSPARPGDQRIGDKTPPKASA